MRAKGRQRLEVWLAEDVVDAMRQLTERYPDPSTVVSIAVRNFWRQEVASRPPTEESKKLSKEALCALILELRDERRSFQHIAEELTRRKILTPSGKREWTTGSVFNLFKS